MTGTSGGDSMAVAHVLKFTLCYEGTAYVGWQRQPNGVSIQALLEDALAPLAGGPVAVIGAGRTDAGVHALGQVASALVATSLEPAVIRRALNATLPDDVRVISVEHAAESFHARFDARRKHYRYQIVNGDTVAPFDRRYTWHVVPRLDVEAMRRAAAVLVGTHDFAAFQAAGSSAATTTRTIDVSAIEMAGDPVMPGLRHIRYEVCADGFLRHMVRAIAGTLVDIGAGRWSADAAAAILASCDRAQAGPTAPAHGLFLIAVEY